LYNWHILSVSEFGKIDEISAVAIICSGERPHGKANVNEMEGR